MKPELVFFGGAKFGQEDAAMMAVADTLISALKALGVEPESLTHPIEVMSAHLTQPETTGLTTMRAQLIAAGMDPGVMEASVIMARKIGAEVLVTAFLPDEPLQPTQVAPGMN